MQEAAALVGGCLWRRKQGPRRREGGSTADAQHLAAEPVCRFRQDRGSLAAIARTTDASVLTAIGNDYGLTGPFRDRFRP